MTTSNIISKELPPSPSQRKDPPDTSGPNPNNNHKGSADNCIPDPTESQPVRKKKQNAKKATAVTEAASELGYAQGNRDVLARIHKTEPLLEQKILDIIIPAYVEEYQKQIQTGIWDFSRLLFRRGTYVKDDDTFQLCKVSKDPKTGVLEVEPLSDSNFKLELDRMFFIYKLKNVAPRGEDPDWVEEENKLSVDTARTLRRDLRWRKALPEIRRVVSAPRPYLNREYNKLELANQGYHEATKTLVTNWGPHPEGVFGSTDDAVEYLKDLLSAFCFEEMVDDTTPVRDINRDKAIALGLTLYTAEMIRPEVIPAFWIDANQPGCGKDYLGHMLVRTSTGDDVRSGSYPTNDEEMNKSIISRLMSGSTVMYMANIGEGRVVKGDSLEGLLTTAKYEGRVLGGITMAKPDNTLTCIFTGNGGNYSDDIRRRLVRINLHSELTREEHQIEMSDKVRRRDVKREAIRDECKVRAAYWAIISAWIDAGRPANVKGLPSFEEWGNLVGGSMVHAGLSDPTIETPLSSASAVMDDAAQSIELFRVMAETSRMPHAPKPEVSQTGKEIRDLALKHELITWLNYSQPGFEHRFGRYLTGKAGKAVVCPETGIRYKLKKLKGGSNRWVLTWRRP